MNQGKGEPKPLSFYKDMQISRDYRMFPLEIGKTEPRCVGLDPSVLGGEGVSVEALYET